MELLGLAESVGAIGATISGAGPAVLYWCFWQDTGKVVDALGRHASDLEVRRARFTPLGADVPEL
jgi:homoserine kinase